jgi:hypothetical protein
MILIKIFSLQYFFAINRIIAAKKPINEIPIPAKIPNPHICDFVRVDDEEFY